MEKRQLGKTDMQVSVLGFGGAEIGFEGATAPIIIFSPNAAIPAESGAKIGRLRLFWKASSAACADCAPIGSI
jgi:hypothetical protein